MKKTTNQQEARALKLKNLQKTLDLIKNKISAEEARKIFNFENTGQDRSKLSKRLLGTTEISLEELKNIRQSFSLLRSELSDSIIDLDSMIESEEHLKKLQKELEDAKNLAKTK